MILRPTLKRDLDDLVALAGQLDSMNLPRDRDFLAQRGATLLEEKRRAHGLEP